MLGDGCRGTFCGRQGSCSDEKRGCHDNVLTVIIAEVGVEDAPQVVNDSLNNTCLMIKTLLLRRHVVQTLVPNNKKLK